MPLRRLRARRARRRHLGAPRALDPALLHHTVLAVRAFAARVLVQAVLVRPFVAGTRLGALAGEEAGEGAEYVQAETRLCTRALVSGCRKG
jgi:hypothetical protein